MQLTLTRKNIGGDHGTALPVWDLPDIGSLAGGTVEKDDDSTVFTYRCNVTSFTSSPSIDDSNGYCIVGEGNGVDWYWEFNDGVSPTSGVVTGPAPPATAGQLRSAFRDSISLAFITDLAATNGPGVDCFTLTSLVGPSTLSVGPVPAGPANCTITGNPFGCAVNPTIYDLQFLPPFGAHTHPHWARRNDAFAARRGGGVPLEATIRLERTTCSLRVRRSDPCISNRPLMASYPVVAPPGRRAGRRAPHSCRMSPLLT